MNNIRTEPYLKDGTARTHCYPKSSAYFVKDFAMLVVLLSIAIAVFLLLP